MRVIEQLVHHSATLYEVYVYLYTYTVENVAIRLIE